MGASGGGGGNYGTQELSASMGRSGPGRSPTSKGIPGSKGYEALGGGSGGGGSGGSRQFDGSLQSLALGNTKGSRLGQSGKVKSRTTTPLSVSSEGPLESAATSPKNDGGVLTRTTSRIDPTSPTLRLTPDGLLLTPNVESSERLGDNLGGDRGQGQTSEPQRPTPPEEPSAPTPAPAPPRQRAAALQRRPAVPEERTLLTLSLADVTKKSLLGI